MKRIWLRVVLISLLLLGTSGCFKSEDPEDIYQAYLASWKQMDFEKMYQYLSQATKEKVSKEQFVNRYKKIYQGIEAKALKVEAIKDEQADDESEAKAFRYRLKMDTLAGPIEFDNDITIVKETDKAPKDWGVAWDPSLIFPSMEEGDQISVQHLDASRGEIRDKNGSGLAINAETNVIGVVPEKLESDQAKSKLQKLLDIEKKEMNQILNASWVKPNSFVPLATLPVSEKNLDAYLVIPGVKAQEKTVRFYPFGPGAAHLTGYVREITAEQLAKRKGKGYSASDIIGQAGLESVFEDRLKGKNGVHIFIKHADGSLKQTLAKVDAVPGEDIQLTIDAALQDSIYQQLDGDAGTAAAIEPKTGEILSLVSSPSYDPNAFVTGLSDEQWTKWSKDPKKPLLNRFTNLYAPGSVFKTLTAAVGLKTGITDPNKVRYIDDLNWSKDESWGDYYVTRVSAKPKVTLRDAFVYSDNIYFAQEALDIGLETYTQEIKRFGFEEKLPTPITIKPSILSNKGIKNEIHLADSAYGQGEVMMSPLHLALVYTPFINNGDMLHAHLLKDEKRKIWRKKIVSPEIANEITNYLIQVVEDPNGTARGAYIPGMTIAGKSGTAEIKATKEDKDGTENGWFVGYDTEQAKLLLTMMVEDVKERGGSGYVVSKSGKIFHSIK
ncbi:MULTISPECIES: penicillin-binding transpeptidase domain-containing protein [Clostridia]|uniref:penicillin-binding transpeptidase domain-containing protein n=1 Tax=Clostridia TaxID=186801 RepID=UPI0013145C0A|nr:penicillin-binding transpeptidase domain-containing protein [Clostridium sp. 1xD42-85]